MLPYRALSVIKQILTVWRRFLSLQIQLPSEKVIEAAQETEPTELQGYLIKQGGGGNAFNPLGRKNWKQRYFILLGSSLIYAKTKDDYERGKIIKELHINGYAAAFLCCTYGFVCASV